MNIDDFLKNGTPIKNPNYKKPSKSNPAGSTRIINSDNYWNASDYGTTFANMLAEGSYDLTDLNNPAEKWEEYGVTVNPINTYEELQRERAENQSNWEKAGNVLVQGIGNEVVLATIAGFANIVDAGINLFTPEGEQDYTNPVSTWTENWQNEIRNRFEIFEKDPNATWAISDFGWWANNGVSVLSTAGLLLPSTGMTKGISMLGKIPKLGKYISKAGRGTSVLGAKMIKKVTGTTRSTASLSRAIDNSAAIGATALFSRTAENYQEARGVYNELKDSTLAKIQQMSAEDKQRMIERNPELKGKTDEEMANYIASLGAHETYINDFAMLLMDVAQFKAIGSLWKGLSKKTPSAKLRTKNKEAISKLTGEGIETAERTAVETSWLKNRYKNIKEIVKHPLTTIEGLELSEGFEEGYQGVQTEKGKEVAQMIMNPEYMPKSVADYLVDPAIWEQAFWGIAGGFLFQKGGKALGNVYRKGSNYIKYKRGKLSEEDFKLNMTAEEKIRAAEIEGRSELNKKFIDDMNMLNDLKDPDNIKRDAVTSKPIEEDGVTVHESLTPEEATIRKAQVVNNYITSMAIRAKEAGNFELFRDYVSSEEFDQHFKDAGLNLEKGDKSFSQQLLAKAEEVADNYETNLYNVIRNTELENDSIIKSIARGITRQQLELEEYSEQRDLLQNKIDELNTGNIDINAYKRKAILDYVKKQLDVLDKQQQAMFDAYNKKQISLQAKIQYEKDYNSRRKSLIKLLNDSTSFDETITKQIKDLYKNIKNNNGEILGEIQTAMSVVDSVFKDETTIDIPKSITDLINKQVQLEDGITYTDYILPKTQEDYKERADLAAQQMDLFTIQKFNNAAKKVEDYIIKQDNLDQAFQDIIEGKVDDLKNELDLLKLGYYNSKAYFDSIKETVEEERAKRIEKEKKDKEISIDGKKAKSKKAEEIKNDIDEVAEKAEANRDKPLRNPSTGKNSKSGKSSLKDHMKERDRRSKDTKNDNNENKTNNTEKKPSNQKSTKPTLEEQVSKATITEDEFSNLEEAAKVDAEKIAESYEININDQAVGKASMYTFELYKTSKNLFDEALGKDIESPEVQKILDLIQNKLEKDGVSSGFAPAATKRGVRVALKTISNILNTQGDSNATKFKVLANSIAAGYDLRGGMAAITKTLRGEELNKVIDDLLEVYKNYKEIATPKGQKTVINLKLLFNDIIFNEEVGIDFETALHILWNMKDYMNNPLNTKYEFSNKRFFNNMLKNPAEFYTAIRDARTTNEQLDSYMHISPSTKKSDEYNAIIAGLKGGEEVELQYFENRNGEKNSISIIYKGKEIGFISTVKPSNNKNTAFKIFINKYKGGIAYNIEEIENGYKSNTDELFSAIFDQEDILWELVNKKYRHRINSGNKDITEEEAEKFINHPAIKKAIDDGVIILPVMFDAHLERFINNPIVQQVIKQERNLPKKYSEKIKVLLEHPIISQAIIDGRINGTEELLKRAEHPVVEKYTRNIDKAKFIANILEGVVFYNQAAQNYGEYMSSYRRWIKNAYTNYKNTFNIQSSLNKNSKISTKFVGSASTYNTNDSVTAIIDETENKISDIGLTFDRNPIVGVVNSDGNAILINEQTGKTISSSAPFNIGSMGMLIGGREDTPILALFSSANKLGDKIRKQLNDELIDILTGFQERKYTYEEVDKKLSSLFNGPGIGTPTIFQGYSVLRSDNMLALSIGGQSKKYTLIINKFKKGTNERGTGIIYSPEGNTDEARTTISVNKEFIQDIVDEICDNVVYNKTFYTLNNIGKDNTNDNPYMYKENGKFVINLGGTKTVYENFGDFVLKENAFNTYQGVNENGGYFDNTDKVNSLYIDISVVKVPTSKTSSPVEGEQYKSIADTIKTASAKKSNPTRELFEKAGIPEQEIDFLEGNNIYEIPLLPKEYYYMANLTNAYALYKNNKIYISPSGATEFNKSPISIRRILLHENLHKRINDLKLFNRKELINDLFDTYNATIEAVDNILKNGDKNSNIYKQAKEIKEKFLDNNFNPKSYFTQFSKKKNEKYAAKTQEERDAIFAEEWLVETLTQSGLMRFLNEVEYKGQEVKVDGINNENKTIWQKIIDLLLKLFHINGGNVKNNTIFAKQYLILGNINNNNNVNGNSANINESNQPIEENKLIEEETSKSTNDTKNEDKPTEAFESKDFVENAEENVEENVEEDNEFFIEEEETSESKTTIENNGKKIIKIEDDNDEVLATTKDIKDYKYSEEEQNILDNAPRNSQGQLLAPNGQISNLTERQYVQVRTKAFKEWFGDWENNPLEASKVVDENYEPLVVYHRTPEKEINIFDIKKSDNYGFWFSADKDYYTHDWSDRKNYNTISAFINIRNPNIISHRDFGEAVDGSKEQDLSDTEFDGWITINYYIPESYMEYDWIEEMAKKHIDIDKKVFVMAIKPNQIKSATDNIGTFDPNNDDIRYATIDTIEDVVLDNINNDGGATAETFGVTRITNMSDYINMYASQYRPLIANMLENGELRYACR